MCWVWFGPLAVNDHHCVCTLGWSRRQVYRSHDFLQVTFEIVYIKVEEEVSGK